MNPRLLLLAASLAYACILTAQETSSSPAAPAAAPAVEPASAPVAAPVVAPAVVPAVPAAPAKPGEPEVKIKDAPATQAVIKSIAGSAGVDTLSVDFADEEIRTILRNVADLFELNLVIPDTLQGKTSVKLRDVSWRQIFKVVLAPVGYSFVEENNIIKVVSNESLQAEPVSTEVFILNYARASDIQASIASLVDTAAGGKMVIDARSNAIILTERPSRVIKIRPIIESLDRATDQVMIETKFIEVTDGDVRALGAKWNSMSGMELGVGAGGQNGQYGTYNRTQTQGKSGGTNSDSTAELKDSNSTTTSGSNSRNANSDTSSKVISDNGALSGSSVTNSASSLASGLATTTAAAASGTANTVLNNLSALTNGNNTDRTLSAVFSATDFKVILSALTTLSNTRIVSNPTIVTLNNTEAFINVGSEYPIPNYTYNQERGTYEVSGFTYRPIGIILKVTPQVNSRGFVKLTVEPEVSQQNGTAPFGTAQIPIIATRKAKTQVSLKDGYTMGIGGLLRKEVTDGASKVPILGDIPGLGYLFKQKTKNATTTNLLIFITARVVSAEGGSIQQIFDPRQVQDMQLNEKDLPGYREEKSALIPANAQPEKKGWFGKKKSKKTDSSN